MVSGKASSVLKKFVTRWEMAWHAMTVGLYLLAIGLVVLVFPDVSNLWVSLFVLFGTFTASVTAMIGAIKSRGES